MANGNNSPRSDAELLRALGEGDETAAQELYERYARPVAKAVLKVLSPQRCNHQQEVIDDVWLTMLGEKKILAANPKYLPAYLITAARNRSFNHHRDVHKNLPTLPEAEPVDIQTSLEVSELIDLLLKSLSPVEVQIVARRMEGFSNREIADELGLKEGKVKAIYGRVIGKFKKLASNKSGR